MTKRSAGRSPSKKVRDAPRSSKSAKDAHEEDLGIEINGWVIFAHPLFLEQIENLTTAIEKERRARARRGDTASSESSANEKTLAAIMDLAFSEIPKDPTARQYRQGDTLGRKFTNWSRAKFGNGRFRLFFRFRTDVRVIVYAWVNDKESLRTRGSRRDAYATFRRMLEGGDPPNSWESLVAAARSPDTRRRTYAVLSSQSADDRPPTPLAD